jgi:hypothetical protein
MATPSQRRKILKSAVAISMRRTTSMSSRGVMKFSLHSMMASLQELFTTATENVLQLRENHLVDLSQLLLG